MQNIKHINMAKEKTTTGMLKVEVKELENITGKKMKYIIIGEGLQRVIINCGETTFSLTTKLINGEKIETEK